jgi:hypothetical protein
MDGSGATPTNTMYENTLQIKPKPRTCWATATHINFHAYKEIPKPKHRPFLFVLSSGATLSIVILPGIACGGEHSNETVIMRAASTVSTQLHRNAASLPHQSAGVVEGVLRYHCTLKIK